MNDNQMKYVADLIINLEKAENRIKELEQINEEHRKLNGQLRSNWDSLREWLEDYFKDTFYVSNGIVLTEILDKMNELEGVDNETR